MKQWGCVELKEPKLVGETIELWQEKGWRLHTYTCAPTKTMGGITAGAVNIVHVAIHYLLFEKGE